jgi:hypothetical protein
MPAQITSHPQDVNGKTLGHVYVAALFPLLVRTQPQPDFAMAVLQ